MQVYFDTLSNSNNQQTTEANSLSLPSVGYSKPKCQLPLKSQFANGNGVDLNEEESYLLDDDSCCSDLQESDDDCLEEAGPKQFFNFKSYTPKIFLKSILNCSTIKALILMVLRLKARTSDGVAFMSLI